MKPTPNQTIDGIRDLLREKVLGHLSSDTATTEVQRILAVLRDIDWNETAFAWLRENTVLTQLAIEAISWIESHAPGSAVLAAPAVSLRQCIDAPPIEQTFEAVHARQIGMRAALAGFIDSTAEHGQLDTSATLLELRAHMARELASVAARGPSRRRDRR
jgi:hypothetical protein